VGLSLPLFHAVAYFERFYAPLTNDDLLVRGIAYGLHFFPDPADYKQAIALAQYHSFSTSIQMPAEATFWARFRRRFDNFDATKPIPFDLNAGPYVDEVLDDWDAFKDSWVISVRVLENRYFFDLDSPEFLWVPSQYSRTLPDPGADPSYKYDNARFPMDIRAALEYWQYRIYWVVDAAFTPLPKIWQVRKAARAVEEIRHDGPCDPNDVLYSGAMQGWAGQLHDKCVQLMQNHAVGYQDGPRWFGVDPEYYEYYVVHSSDGFSHKALGAYAYTGFLEIGHQQGYRCDVRLGISRIIFSVVVNDQIPEQFRQAALHIGIFTDLLDEIGTWDIEILRLPDDTHLLSYGDQFDAFNDAGNVTIDTVPMAALVDDVLIFDVTPPEYFENTATGRVNYGLRVVGDTLGWAGGGNLIAPSNVPLNGTDNPLCNWDRDVPCDRGSWQAGVGGSCTVRADSGFDTNDDGWVTIDNTFVFVNVTQWYPELMGIDFWP